MAAEVKKIRPDICADPKMLLGMLTGHAHKIRHIAAVVVWDDDDQYQFVNTKMPHHAMALCSVVFQHMTAKDIMEDC